jgi:hypothetical protein
VTSVRPRAASRTRFLRDESCRSVISIHHVEKLVVGWFVESSFVESSTEGRVA